MSFELIAVVFFVLIGILNGLFMLSSWFNVFYKTTFLGYKKVRITTSKKYDPLQKQLVLITRDGHHARDPIFDNCWNYDLLPNGEAKFRELSFAHAKWEYI